MKLLVHFLVLVGGAVLLGLSPWGGCGESFGRSYLLAY